MGSTGFKVGDKVKVIRDFRQSCIDFEVGQTGTIKAIKDDYISIQWDFTHKHLWNCGEVCKEGTGYDIYWENRDCLKVLIEVGDRITVVIPFEQGGMKFGVGDTGTVLNIRTYDFTVEWDFTNVRFFWDKEFGDRRENCCFYISDMYIKNMEVIRMGETLMSKSEVKVGDKLTLRNGDELFMVDENNAEGLNNANGRCLSYYAEDLTRTGTGGSALDVVQVERPVYVEVFKRPVEIIELTVRELEEKLGYVKDSLKIKGEK
jgi:hypothetical protein